MIGKKMGKREMSTVWVSQVFYAMFLLLALCAFLACDGKERGSAPTGEKTSQTLVSDGEKPAVTPTPNPTKVEGDAVVVKTPTPKAVQTTVIEKLNSVKTVFDWYRARRQFLAMDKQDPAVQKLIDEKEEELLKARPNKVPYAYIFSNTVEIMGILYRRPKNTSKTNPPEEPCPQEIVMLVRTLKKLDLDADVGFSFYLKMDDSWARKLTNPEERMRNGVKWWTTGLKSDEVWEKGEYHIIYNGGKAFDCPVEISVQMYLTKDGKPSGYFGRSEGLSLGWQMLADE